MADDDVRSPDLRPGIGSIWAWRKSGIRRIVDVAPGIGFLIAYSTAGIRIGIVVAVGLALMIGGVRLARGASIRSIAIMLIVVVGLSLLVNGTGQGRNFFLPGMLMQIALTLALGLGVFTSRPLALWIMQRLRMESRDATAARIRLHRWITAAWFVFSTLALLVMVALYVCNEVAALGIVEIVGRPVMVVIMLAIWLVVRRSKRATPVAHPQVGEPQ